MTVVRLRLDGTIPTDEAIRETVAACGRTNNSVSLIYAYESTAPVERAHDGRIVAYLDRSEVCQRAAAFHYLEHVAALLELAGLPAARIHTEVARLSNGGEPRPLRRARSFALAS